MTTRATFKHYLGSHQGNRIITIIDEDRGMSVTNDIENVVKEIESLHGLDADDYLIIYRDTDGTWDGWDNKNQLFIPLSAANEEEATEGIIAWKGLNSNKNTA